MNEYTINPKDEIIRQLRAENKRLKARLVRESTFSSELQKAIHILSHRMNELGRQYKEL